MGKDHVAGHEMGPGIESPPPERQDIPLRHDSGMGVVAVLTNNRGQVITTAADFDGFHPGGFTVLEAQKMRIKAAIAEATIRAYCSEDIVDSIIARGRPEDVLHHMIDRRDFIVTIIPVGHPNDAK
jgi:hypothetical protein